MTAGSSKLQIRIREACLQKADERTSRGGERYTNDSEAFFACRGNPAWNEVMQAALPGDNTVNSRSPSGD
jgi:hypothetical protein